MAIKITDNMMNRPMEPGSGVRGLDLQPERVFGNAVAPVAQSPNVVAGVGGPRNMAAGKDAEAAAQAFGAIGQSLTSASDYIDKLQTAEEDSRASAAMLDIRVKEQGIRKALGDQAAVENWSSEDYKQRYTDALEAARDETFSNLGLSKKAVVNHYDQQWKKVAFEYGAQFDEQVIKPRAVAQVADNAQKTGDAIVAEAISTGTVEAVAAAADKAQKFAMSPQVVAVIGPVKAQALAENIKTRAGQAVLERKLDTLTDLERGPLAGLTGDGINDLATLGDAKSQMHFYLDSIDMAPDTREQLRSKYDDMLDRSFKAKQKNIAQDTKDRIDAERAARKYTIDMVDVGLGSLAADRKLTPTVLEQRVNQLLKDPSISSDPDAVLQVGKMRNKYLDDVRRYREHLESMAATKATNMFPTSQKAVDDNWKEFSRTQLGGKTYAQLDSAGFEKVGAWIRDTRPLYLPKEIDSALSYGLLSRDKAEFNRSYTLFQQLKQQAPHLVGFLDKRALDMAERVGSGQTYEQAYQAATRQTAMTQEEQQAAKQIVSKTLDKWKTIDQHPLAKQMDVKQITPAAMALYNRNFEDAVLSGLSPQAAQTSALATTSSRLGVSTLLSFDGAKTIALDAPEKVLGAKSDDIREDILDKGKSFGITKDTKWALQPIGRQDANGRPAYAVMIQDKDGATHFAQSQDGKRLIYSFDPDTVPAVKRQREVQRVKDVASIYNDLYVEGVRSGAIQQPVRRGTMQKPLADPRMKPLSEIGLLDASNGNESVLKKTPWFRADLWDKAVQRYNESK